jgi:hypothetical protein
MKISKTITPGERLSLQEWYNYISLSVCRLKGITKAQTVRKQFPIGKHTQNKFKK